MTTHIFTAQDASGGRCRIQVIRGEAGTGAHDEDAGASRYVLEDGSHVRRIDNDTFQIIGTGAYVTRVAE